jgi:CheY-like chemotaxis protein
MSQMQRLRARGSNYPAQKGDQFLSESQYHGAKEKIMEHRLDVDTTTVQLSDLPALTAKSPVLVSDDHTPILTLIKYALERRHLTVIAALDPHDTLDICRKAPISLVISDVMKPGMSGFDMLDCLRSDPVTTRIPLMFVSASCTDIFWDGTRRGADGAIRKPFLCDELSELTHKLLLTRANWERPSAFDSQVFAALTDTTEHLACGDWHREVWTTRKLGIKCALAPAPIRPTQSKQR